MTSFLHDHPLLILFGIIAFGYLLAKVEVRGFSLGVAAVLFMGLLVGWLAPGVELPEFVPQLGLVLFVYTLGLASGHGFFAALRLRGLRDNALALGVVGISSVVVWGVGTALGMRGPQLAGVRAGALTNPPARARAVDALKGVDASPTALAAPVLAYSICYPLGVLIPLIAVWRAGRTLQFDHEEPGVASYAPGTEPIVNATLAVEVSQRLNARQLRKTADWSVNFGRIRRGSHTKVVHDEEVFAPGDLVTVIGTQANLAAVAKALGSISNLHIDWDRSEIDYRRMFVSNAEVTGLPLKDLHLAERHEAVVTRVRRGDVDLVPDPEFELEPGDRVRVLAPRARMSEVQALFGDSLRRASEVDVITFGLGIALGLLLGAVPWSLASGRAFTLGLAGGPLIAGLVLGRLGRTGPLVWSLPFGANLTLRQFGLVLFLAGVGLRAGGLLAETLRAGDVLPMLVTGALVVTVSTTLSLLVGHTLLRIPLPVMLGMLSGIQTQPAVLALAVEKSRSDLPNMGYATVYPIAMVAKIVFAQVLIYVAR